MPIEETEHVDRRTNPGGTPLPVIQAGIEEAASAVHASLTPAGDDLGLDEQAFDAAFDRASAGAFVQDLQGLLAMLEGRGGEARVNILDVMQQLEAQAKQFSVLLSTLSDEAHSSFYAALHSQNRDAALAFWHSVIAPEDRDRLAGLSLEQLTFLGEMQDSSSQAAFIERFEPYDDSNHEVSH